MDTLYYLDSIEQCNQHNGQDTLHPLVTVLDLSKNPPSPGGKIHFGLYSVFLKEANCNALKYGREYYDYQKGTLVFISPGQIVATDEPAPGQLYQPSGWVLYFHPDLIRGSSLGQSMRDYTFFSYAVREALHLSEQERQIVLDCFSKIQTELERGIDKYSKKLIVSTIEYFLDYCMRFYDRQFITREQANKGIVQKFEDVLDAYFKSDKIATSGQPSVSYCADSLHLSAKYFGDLIKKETGRTAQEYIQSKLIDRAKDSMMESQKTISEIAYELGFAYPQHFTRLFKQKTGLTPHEYRIAN